MFLWYIKEIQFRSLYLLLFTLLITLISYSYSQELIFIMLVPYSIELDVILFLFKGFFEILGNYIFVSLLCGIVYFILGLIYNMLTYIIQIVEKKYIIDIVKSFVRLGVYLIIFDYIIYKYLLGKIYKFFMEYMYNIKGGVMHSELELSMYNYIYVYVIILFINILIIVGGIIGRRFVGLLKVRSLEKYRKVFICSGLFFAVLTLPADGLIHLIFLIILYVIFDIWAVGLCIKKSYIEEIEKKKKKEDEVS